MKKAIDIAQKLIQCPSVTPDEAGALSFIESLLKPHGFVCHRLAFSESGTSKVENLYARWGRGVPHFCFAGHIDVVPPGRREAWSFDPFGGEIRDGFLCGRGASDMKGAVAAFVSAALEMIEKIPLNKGSISLLLTADEEGPAVNGTRPTLEWMQDRGEIPDFCLVGEPTSDKVFGDTVKIGRRGSLSGTLTVQGIQGHVAYPQLADNPIPKMLTLLQALDDLILDQGTEYFQPSNLEIVDISVSAGAENVIPAWCRAVFNIRFNDHYTAKNLESFLRTALDRLNIPYQLQTRYSGESFYTPPGTYSDLVVKAIQKETGHAPQLSTSGGTSDARFIRQYCPVVEFGVCNATAHKIDERVPVQDIESLAFIYVGILKSFFA